MSCEMFAFKSFERDGALRELMRKTVVEISFPPRSLTVKSIPNPAARQEVIGQICEISAGGYKQERAECPGTYCWGFVF